MMTTEKSQHKNYKLSFKDFSILKIAFEVSPIRGEGGNIEPGIGLARKYSQEEKTLNVFLRVWLPEGVQPYHFEIISVGKFFLSENPDEKTLENFARINCPSILYPYVRESIADITRRAGFPPLHLPPVNFVNLNLKPQMALGDKKIGKSKKK